VAAAKLAISEYLDGRYRSELLTMEKDLAIAESDLRTAKNMLAHAKQMAERGYVSDLQVEQGEFNVTQATLNVEVKNTRIGVLKDFTKKMELETLQGNLKAAQARLAADEERAKMDAIRRDLAVEELEYCAVRSELSGMVIHPSAARWENAPKIEEGSTVHKDQVLLLMPDLSRMEVKVGIPESSIDRIKPGLAARVTLPDKTLDGEVSSVASVTRPAGWWNGNVVEYDTLVELPPEEGLKPGMSAEVEVIVARHEDVLTIPVAAVAETAEGNVCWVKTSDGVQRRMLKLGDTNDIFSVVKDGLKEGDEVMLNPYAFMEETAMDTPKPAQVTESTEPISEETDSASKPPEPKAAKPSKKETKPQATKPKQAESQMKKQQKKETKAKKVR
jgi:biotin carboxyl carrier protein